MLDIVIPVHGRFDLLSKCLESVPKACGRYPYKIYAVDDASPGGISATKRFFQDYPSIDVSYNTVNVGFPSTVNKGAKKGSNKFILLLNSDVVLEPGAIDLMMDRMVAEPKLGVLGLKLLFPTDAHPADQGIRAPGRVQHVGISFDIHAEPHHIFVGWHDDNPRVNSINMVPAVTGAVFLTRRELWKNFRGMDTIWGRGTWEDVDYCFKVRTLDYYVAVETRAKGHHYTGGSSVAAEVVERKPFPLAENKQIFYNRWANQIHWSDAVLL